MNRNGLLAIVVIALSLCARVTAQTTEFTHQGLLAVSGSPANGNFDLEFRLFNAITGGTQQGPTIQRLNVAVANGIYAVALDFGTGPFSGADRFLDISVRTAGGGSFTQLTPRQKVTSSPYAVRSLNAANADTAVNADTAATAAKLGGVLAADYLQTNGNGSGLTNLNVNNVTTGTLAVARGGTGLTASGASGNYLRSNGSSWLSSTLLASDLPPGNGNYIQNTTSPQPTSNFNISGNGTAAGTLSGNIVNAATQFDLGGSRILSSPGTGNLFAGANAGLSNTTGSYNTFFGSGAGVFNTYNSANSFFGSFSGTNTTGFNNAFFGGVAGNANTTGSNNSFFGTNSGVSNTTGSNNSFFGEDSGYRNTAGILNAFFGLNAGGSNTTGESNTFLGAGTGFSNTTGNGNTVIGMEADVGSGGLTNATAIGTHAKVTSSNSLVLGGILNTNSCTPGNNCGDTNVGIGTTAPAHRLSVIGGPAWTSSGWAGSLEIADASAIGWRANAGGQRFGIGHTGGGLYFFRTASDPATTANAATYDMLINDSGSVGIGTISPQRLLHVNGRARVGTIPSEASIASVCFNVSGDLLQCGASSLRWKTNVQPFSSGLGVITRLRPIRFNWKEDGRADIGLGAEDVAKVDPSLTFTDANGDIAGVKYEKMTMLLINAVKELKAQNDKLTAGNNELKAENKALQSRVTAIETRLNRVRRKPRH